MADLAGARREGPRRILDAVVFAAAVAVLIVFAAGAARLAAYPFDWSPDEGLRLDYARRLREAPGTLYSRTTVPFPMAWTPLLPVLLAPIVAASDHPLAPARALACLWTAVIAGSVYLLVRRRARWPLALATAALSLAVLDLSIWFLLVRIDGLMLALWLAAAVALMPDTLVRGAERLSWPRAGAGAALLLAAVLAKPTAVAHGAPLVLAWWLLDPRSGFRVSLLLGSGGLAALGLLQAATGGGFLWVMRLWATHPHVPGLLRGLVEIFAASAWPVAVLCLAALTSAIRGRAGAARDGALLLLAGALVIVPAMGKSGAAVNYLLPALCAMVILAGRWWGRSRPDLGAAATAVVAGVLAATGALPLPLQADRATAEAFYGYVRRRGAPILATRPDYAYFLLGQPVEAEGSSMPYLVPARVAGIDTIIDRVERRAYRTVIAVSYFWPNDPRWEQALARHYRIVGACGARLLLREDALHRPGARRRRRPSALRRVPRRSLLGRRALSRIGAGRVPQERGPRRSNSTAFCTCSRFSACSNTTDCGPSMTSASTSSPRCAGRQCMNTAWGLAAAIRSGVTVKPSNACRRASASSSWPMDVQVSV